MVVPSQEQAPVSITEMLLQTVSLTIAHNCLWVLSGAQVRIVAALIFTLT